LQITILTDSTSKAVRQFYVLYVEYCHRKKIELCFAKILVILLGGVFTIYGLFANIWTDPGGRAT